MELKFDSLDEMKQFHDTTFGFKEIAINKNTFSFSLLHIKAGTASQKDCLRYSAIVNERTIEHEFFIDMIEFVKDTKENVFKSYHEKFINIIVTISITDILLENINKDIYARRGL